VTDPATAIKQELQQLVQQQISTLGHPSCLTYVQLHDYHARAKRIKMLYRELDQIGRDRMKRSLRLVAQPTPFLSSTFSQSHSRNTNAA
jgi:hypothetical protein